MIERVVLKKDAIISHLDMLNVRTFTGLGHFYCSSIVKGLKSLFGVFELFTYSKSTMKELSFDPSLKFLRQLEVGEKKSMTSYFFRFP